MSPMKKPKLSVAAKTMKKPKMTFSRFIGQGGRVDGNAGIVASAKGEGLTGSKGDRIRTGRVVAG
jgi:hypothetical protein